jgi:FkbM family methyltransferase
MILQFKRRLLYLPTTNPDDMTGTIKAWLLQLLGQEKYLRLTSAIFFVAYHKGWLRNNPSYFTHYMATRFIRPGFTIIDIGANLGYYSCIFASKTGASGKVLAVEPIELYRRILTKNTADFPQVTILPFALGETEGTLKMGNPSQEKHRHGLMRVLRDDEAGNEFYEVPVKNPLQLFNDLPKIDYIKCDIEGYEVPVIPAMRPLIEKHRPLMQVETEGENKKLLMQLFKGLKYLTFYAVHDNLIPYHDADKVLSGDLIAIPEEKMGDFGRWVKG